MFTRRHHVRLRISKVRKLGPLEEKAATPATADADLGSLERQGRGRVRSGLRVALDPSRRPRDGHRGKRWLSATRLLAVGRGVGQDHADAAASLTTGLSDAGADAGRIGRSCRRRPGDPAFLRGRATSGRGAGVAAHVDHGVCAAREVAAAPVERDAGGVGPAAELDGGREVAIHGAGGDGGYPGGDVGEADGVRPAVPGRAGDEDAHLHRPERGDGQAVAVVRGDAAAEGDGEHVDAVGHRAVDRREDVGAEAAAGPAHLVGRHAGTGRHAARRAARVAEEVGARDGRARHRGGRVRPVPVLVPRRLELARPVDRPGRGLVAAVEDPGAHDLPLRLKSRPTSHAPFHRAGTGPMPLSLKLGLSGQIPVSSTPTTASWSASTDDHTLLLTSGPMPRNSGLLVVCSSYTVSGSTDTTPGMPLLSSCSASASLSRAAKP
ncbi:hypothetical protein ACMD2_22227 [Ananas comosus]|uniref:Uncharacterized protein n=1 Tax=Ananas comosus TaxID=4615 RepID=A0A199UYQ1_ANACO|nr:hypothetical protein ACMD2_22227 [Ananas comosus]